MYTHTQLHTHVLTDSTLEKSDKVTQSSSAAPPATILDSGIDGHISPTVTTIDRFKIIKMIDKVSCCQTSVCMCVCVNVCVCVCA